jgi:ClpP class serine protease
VERLERLQHDLHETFKDAVRERRGAKLSKDVPELFEGEIFTGRRAVELGLVDGLGDLRAVMRTRFGEDVRLRVVAPPRQRWRRWAPGARAARPDLGEMVGEIWGAIEERLHWGRFGL